MSESSPDRASNVDPDDVLWIGISNSPANTVVRGPYTNEQAAVESVAEFDSFHAEPRVPQDDADEPCIPENIGPSI